MNRLHKEKRGPIRWGLDLVIGFLCVILVGTVIFAVSTIKEDWNYSHDVDSFYYRLQDEDFGTMVEMYYRNKEAGVKGNRELQQYYGIAEYFEAASYYKAYKETGREEQLKKYADKMEHALTHMGELSFVSDSICQSLGF